MIHDCHLNRNSKCSQNLLKHLLKCQEKRKPKKTSTKMILK